MGKLEWCWVMLNKIWISSIFTQVNIYSIFLLSLKTLVSCWIKFSSHLAPILLSFYHGKSPAIKMSIITKWKSLYAYLIFRLTLSALGGPNHPPPHLVFFIDISWLDFLNDLRIRDFSPILWQTFRYVVLDHTDKAVPMKTSSLRATFLLLKGS